MPLGFRVERACEAVYGRIMGRRTPRARAFAGSSAPASRAYNNTITTQNPGNVSLLQPS